MKVARRKLNLSEVEKRLSKRGFKRVFLLANGRSWLTLVMVDIVHFGRLKTKVTE